MGFPDVVHCVMVFPSTSHVEPEPVSSSLRAAASNDDDVNKGEHHIIF
jgi:hypothetical protein